MTKFKRQEQTIVLALLVFALFYLVYSVVGLLGTVVVFMAFVPVAIFLLPSKYRKLILEFRQRATTVQLHDIDKQAGLEFEQEVARLFKRKGYSVMVTPASGDFGADVIATDRRGQRTAVQVKRYGPTVKVGPSAVQEVHAARAVYKCQNALVVTNRSYTKSAQVVAKAVDVELWDRGRLADELRTPGVGLLSAWLANVQAFIISNIERAP